MQVKTKGIVISAIKFQDKSLIVKCFTASDGLKSYFIHNAYSASSKQKIAFFQTAQIIEIEAVHKNKDTLERINEVKLHYAYRHLLENFYKSTQLIFLIDVLKICLKEDGENIGLYTFLETSFIWLDTNQYDADFHLVFLMQLTKYLGFMPSNKIDNEHFFEKIEGIFQINYSSSCLNKDESLLFNDLINATYDRPKIFTKSQRIFLTNTLLEYYQWHVEGFRLPKSLEVLKELYS